MPTPGGLPKAGDQLINEGAVYVVVERTSTTAPFSVWVKRHDGGRCIGFRSDNLRERGMEARVPCETGKLPGGWKFFTDARQPIPRHAEQRADLHKVQAMERAEMDGNHVTRYVGVVDAHVWKDEADARKFGCQAEVQFKNHVRRVPDVCFTCSDEELLNFIIAASAYLRDKEIGRNEGS